MIRCLGAVLVGVAFLACGSSESKPDPAGAGAGAVAGGGSSPRGGAGGSGGSGSGQAGALGNAGGAGGDNTEGGDAGEGAAGAVSSAGAGGGAAMGGTFAGSSGASGHTGGSDGDVCSGCASGVCLEDATCVECTSDEHCAGERAHCDVTTSACVECTPSADDCAAGSYCSAELTCVPGCKDDASCASGVCGETHDCQLCLTDAECAGGRVCASGACSDPCTGEATACGDGRTCCGGRCVDTSRDIGNCGACSSVEPLAACAETEFCGTTACLPVGIANVCNVPRVALLRGSLRPDDIAGDLVAQALATCTLAPAVREVSQDDAVLTNAQTGQPVGGPGELVVVAGGPFGQRLARYLEENLIAPVSHELVDDAHYELHGTSDGRVLASMPTFENTSAHDFASIVLSRDPSSGTLVLVVSGFNANGTAAGAWYFANVMMPSIASFEGSFYLLEWTDEGAVGADSAEEFVLRASGP